MPHFRKTCRNSKKFKRNKLNVNTVKPAQTTTCLRQPILNPPKPIVIQLLLHKMTTCLMQPATIFLSANEKKNCLKQPLQNLIQQRNEKQCIKNKRLSDYNYSVANLLCKVCIMFKNKKTKHLHLTYFPSIIVVVSALDSQYRSPGFKSLGWLQSQLSLLLFWG